MRVLTCNIRTSHAPDGRDGWRYRRDFCMELIRAREPDLICLQEVSNTQFDDCRRAFPGFDSQPFREGAGHDAPVNAIFYHRDRFELKSAGGYWLSSAPHLRATRDWNTIYLRLAHWLRLRCRDEPGRDFRVVNTHLDIAADFTRYQQARVICQDTQAYSNDFPQILTGDLNAAGDAAAVRALRRIGYHDAWDATNDVPSGGTYHGFAGAAYEEPDEARIDYIFTRGKVSAVACEVIRDCDLTGHYPSDHFFLQADLEFDPG